VGGSEFKTARGKETGHPRVGPIGSYERGKKHGLASWRSPELDREGRQTDLEKHTTGKGTNTAIHAYGNLSAAESMGQKSDEERS